MGTDSHSFVLDMTTILGVIESSAHPTHTSDGVTLTGACASVSVSVSTHDPPLSITATERHSDLET